MTSIFRSYWQKIYRFFAVRKHVTLGSRVHIGLGNNLWAPHLLQVGSDDYIDKSRTIEADGAIGNYVLIGNRIGLVSRLDHDNNTIGTPVRYSPWVGEQPAEASDGGVIKDDVWIGYGAVILSGVHIGRRAITLHEAKITGIRPPR